jgi:hypothetical protein
MRWSRREFLASSVAAGLTGAMGQDLLVPREAQADADVERWQKSPCRFCGTGCGVLVGVRKDRVVAVKGDEECPVNRGLLCIKGYSLPKILYGSDRLTTPLLRKKDSFVPISWDAALDLAARKFTEALAASAEHLYRHLVHPDYRVREEASAAWEALGPRGVHYAALLFPEEHPEVAWRVQRVLARTGWPAAELLDLDLGNQMFPVLGPELPLEIAGKRYARIEGVGGRASEGVGLALLEEDRRLGIAEHGTDLRDQARHADRLRQDPRDAQLLREKDERLPVPDLLGPKVFERRDESHAASRRSCLRVAARAAKRPAVRSRPAGLSR